ncbi:hypothetical protein J7L01_02865 [bacterium]|nr:hypothetical protein [bacterium]
MRKVRAFILGIGILVAAITALGVGLRIKVTFRGIRGYMDPKYIDGKFYRRPIHPGFITQRFPVLISRVAVKKGRWSGGLPTSEELRKR